MSVCEADWGGVGGGGVGEVAAEPAALGGSRNVGLHGSVGTLSVFVPGALPGSLERTVPIGSKKMQCDAG